MQRVRRTSSLNMGSAIVTVPEFLMRLRLKPGSHTLAADWDEGRASINIAGAEGEVVFVELVGSVRTWSSNYRLERGDAKVSRGRAARQRLVADGG